MKKRKLSLLLTAVMGSALISGSSAFAGSDTSSVALATPKPSPSLLSQWWNGSSALGNWFGLGYPLQDHGLTITGSAKQDWLSQTTGGYSTQQRNNWINEEKINALLNFGKLFNYEGLEGLTFNSTWRYRNAGNNPGFASGTASGPSSTFNPSSDTSGLGVRILPQYLQWQSDSSKDSRFLINLGWENPYDQFLQQPLSKDFMNNNIASAKGIGATLGAGIPYVNTLANPALGQTAANGYTQGNASGTKVKNFTSAPVPWSSSYAAWGGTLRVKPTKDTYVQAGLYEAISGVNGVGATQFSATQVYPYTQVPSSLKGAFQSTGLVYAQVGANGQPNGKFAAVGYVPGYGQNHGFNFQGAPANNVNTAAIGATSVVGGPNAANTGNGNINPYNGLYNVNEIGWTPKFGSDKSLAGKYALGGYIWGQENTSFQPTSLVPATFTTTTTPATKTAPAKTTTTATYTPYNAKTPYATSFNNLQWGLYLQADQRLYAVKERVEAPSLSGKNPVDGKNPVVPTTTKVTDKGLYTFNEFTFTPPQNNAMPFYFQTGLVYKGLIPHRDNDSIGVALGAGFYSSYYNNYINNQNHALVNALGYSKNATVPNGPVSASPAQLVPGSTPASSTTTVFYGAYIPTFSSTEVIEAYYKVQINKWASISPDVQWIINPAGNGTLGNELIVGAVAKVTF